MANKPTNWISTETATKANSGLSQSGKKRWIIKLITKYKPADAPVHMIEMRESEEPSSADLSLKNQTALQGFPQYRYRLANQTQERKKQ